MHNADILDQIQSKHLKERFVKSHDLVLAEGPRPYYRREDADERAQNMSDTKNHPSDQTLKDYIMAQTLWMVN